MSFFLASGGVQVIKASLDGQNVSRQGLNLYISRSRLLIGRCEFSSLLFPEGHPNMICQIAPASALSPGKVFSP